MPRLSRFPLLALLAAAACGPPEPGMPVAFGEVCRDEHNGKRVAVEGVLDAGASIFCSNIGGGPVTCGLDLKEDPGDEEAISVYVRQGGGDNEIEEVPESWSRSDLAIHAADGSLVAVNEDRVWVSGELTFSDAGEDEVCFLNADLIERE